eukprot:CAMPEP_0170463772 /NCGR_PEP_ID=MMETSP0123-20130129/8759_1 /TAXON_ID=182087 /ORGANISM="Favella ehrenbergii, Strain Fehren 1" /LENGTH=42 /DNA_ID= /DNA_START= /DNA_END= /DNA_ORIENTATION=
MAFDKTKPSMMAPVIDSDSSDNQDSDDEMVGEGATENRNSQN